MTPLRQGPAWAALPPTAGGPAPLAPEQLATRLRTARRQRNLSLRQLSARSGVSASTLSKIENARLSPNFRVLQALLAALGLPLTQLFAPPASDGRLARRALTRRHEGQLRSPPACDHRLLAGDLRHTRLIPFTSTVRARSPDTLDAWARHPGEAFLLVLSGAVELHCEHHAPVRLTAGDSGYLDGALGHALISVGDTDAEVLWVAGGR